MGSATWKSGQGAHATVLVLPAAVHAGCVSPLAGTVPSGQPGSCGTTESHAPVRRLSAAPYGHVQRSSMVYGWPGTIGQSTGVQ